MIYITLEIPGDVSWIGAEWKKAQVIIYHDFFLIDMLMINK